jgi:hypothetical protein
MKLNCDISTEQRIVIAIIIKHFLIIVGKTEMNPIIDRNIE